MAQRRTGSVTETAARRYMEEHVVGLGQKELLLLLYDGAIKFVVEARSAIEAKDFVRSYQSIVKARDIVTELLCILNFDEGKDVAANLRRLYIYVIGRLTEANFTHETTLLDNVVAILENLRSAWAELDFDAVPAENAAGNGQGSGKNAQAARLLEENSRLLSITV
jgi:flagellar protein FliS